MNYRVYTINEVPYWVFMARELSKRVGQEISGTWRSKLNFLAPYQHEEISLSLLIWADTRQIGSSPGQNKEPHGSTYVIAVIAPRNAQISLQYNPKAGLLGPATFWKDASANNQRERSKTFMVERNSSRLNKESGPEMVMNTIDSLSASPFD